MAEVMAPTWGSALSNGHEPQDLAILYSLVQMGKANGIDPYHCLIALFKALPHAQIADVYEAFPARSIAAGAGTRLMSNLPGWQDGAE